MNCCTLYHNRVGVRISGSTIGDQGIASIPAIAKGNYWDDYIGGNPATDKDIRGIPPVFSANWYAQQIAGYLPLFTYVTPSFISFPSGNPNSCFPAPPRFSNQQLMAKMIQEEGEFSELTDEQKYKFKKGVHSAIKKDTSWMYLETDYDEILREFYEEEQNTSIGLLYEAASLLMTDTALAWKILGSVTPQNSFEENEKIVYEIYLETFARDIFEFTSEQFETLYNIAVQNPAKGGIAVYSARVLLDLEVDDIEDKVEGRYAQQNEQQGVKSINSSGVHSTGKIIPNPAKKYTTYYILLIRMKLAR